MTWFLKTALLALCLALFGVGLWITADKVEFVAYKWVTFAVVSALLLTTCVALDRREPPRLL